MINWKEVAKFASGMAAFNAIGHFAFGLAGVLPIPWFGFTLTQTLNTISAIVSAIIAIILIYYAWIKK